MKNQPKVLMKTFSNNFTKSKIKFCLSLSYDDHNSYLFHINIKGTYLMPGVHKTRLLVRDELYECKCKLNERVCNSKQKMIAW